MKIIEVLFNILEFLFAVFGFCLVVSCISIALSEQGVLEDFCEAVNNPTIPLCIVQKEK